MKVLLLSPLYYGGGAERYARELHQQLPASGVAASMMVARLQQGDPPGVRAIRFPGEKYLKLLDRIAGPIDGRHLGSRWRLSHLDGRSCDVVHLNNLHGGWMSLRAVHRLAQRMPVVWTLHDEWALTGGLPYDLSRVFPDQRLDPRLPASCASCFPGSQGARYRRLVERWLPVPAAFICPSLYLMELLAAHPRLSGVPRFQIPYGLSMMAGSHIDLSRQQARASFGIPPDAQVVLLIAANLASPFKGIPLAIDALRRLGREAWVLILGSGGAAIAAQLPQHTVTPGFVSDPAALGRAYRAATVTLVPSIADNFPYVAMESMACQTPLAAFRVGGLVEMIGQDERGLLTACFDTAELAQNLCQLLDEPVLAERLGAAGRQWVEQKCSMPAAVAATLEVYGRGAPPAFGACANSAPAAAAQ